MGLVRRTKKLLQASVEVLEERYMSPEAVLDRYIGELTNNLESSRAAINALRLEVDRLENRSRELKADENMWEGKARAALGKLKDDELAREALRRKLAAATENRELEKIVGNLSGDIKTMEQSLKPLEKKIRDAKNKKERLAARQATNEARGKIKARLDDSGIGNFKDVEEQLLELEARADILSDLKLLSIKDASGPVPEDESELDGEFERLRREVGKSDKKRS